MLTGRHAFGGDSAVSTLSAILRDEVKPMTEVVPDVPPHLENVIQRCMRKNPDDRWQTMTEVRTALSALKRESDSGALYTSRISPRITATMPEQPVAIQKNGNWKAIAAAVFSILLIVMLLGVWAWPKRKPVVVSRPAQDSVAPQAAAQPKQETLTNDVILTMIQEKVPVDLILDQIHSAKSTSFDLSTPELIRLNKARVPRAIIDQMRNPSAEVPVQTASSTATESATSASTAPRTTSVMLTDGTPFKITLSDAIPNDANLGLPLRFTVADDFQVQGVVVLPKGASVYGEITETPKKRKFLGIGSGKLSFSLSKAQLTDGSWAKVRSLASARTDGSVNQRPVQAASAKGAKDIAAPPGTEYIAYIDGEQHATVPVK
jgi:serine/threonine-protein kinase